MAGGMFRLLRQDIIVIKETILSDFPIPYVNGANFDLKVTPSATAAAFLQ